MTVPADLSSGAAFDDEHLAANGAIVVPVWPLEQVWAACEAVAELGTAPDDGASGCFESDQSLDPGYVQAAEEVAGALLATPSARRPRIRFVWPGEGSGAGLHSPSNVRSEWGPGTRYSIEVVLDGVHDWNGPMWVVPGSHRWAALGADVDEAAAHRLLTAHVVPVEANAGDMIVLHPSVLSVRFPNKDRPRRSLVFEVDRPGVPQQGATSSAITLETLLTPLVEDQLVFSETGPERVPLPDMLSCRTCLRPVGPARQRWTGVHQVRCDDCAQRTYTSRSMSARRPRLVLGPVADVLPEGPGRVLVDASADARLRSDGFAIIDEPVIGADAAASIRDRFGEMRGWSGVGHLNDFNQRDTDYRSAATDLMASELDEILGRLFVDYRPFLHTFLCKWPGEESSLEPHRDWMYVDERAGHRTFLAFVALDDIVDGRGQLQFLRGSHRMDTMWRGTDLRPNWLGHTSVVDRRLEAVSVRAGQCVVWNSALTHSSLPNLSSTPRVGAGVWFAPNSAPLVHFRKLGPDSVGYFEIDSEFYRTENPYRLLVSNPRYEMRERLALDDPDWDAEEVDRRLGELAGERAPAPRTGRLGRWLRRDPGVVGSRSGSSE